MDQKSTEREQVSEEQQPAEVAPFQVPRNSLQRSYAIRKALQNLPTPSMRLSVQLLLDECEALREQMAKDARDLRAYVVEFDRMRAAMAAEKHEAGARADRLREEFRAQFNEAQEAADRRYEELRAEVQAQRTDEVEVKGGGTGGRKRA